MGRLKLRSLVVRHELRLETRSEVTVSAALWTDNGPGEHSCSSNMHTLSLWARGRVESWVKKCYLHPGMQVSAMPLKYGRRGLGPPQTFCWTETGQSGAWGPQLPEVHHHFVWGTPAPSAAGRVPQWSPTYTSTSRLLLEPNGFEFITRLCPIGTSQSTEYLFSFYELEFSSATRVKKQKMNILLKR